MIARISKGGYGKQRAKNEGGHGHPKIHKVCANKKRKKCKYSSKCVVLLLFCRFCFCRLSSTFANVSWPVSSLLPLKKKKKIIKKITPNKIGQEKQCANISKEFCLCSVRVIPLFFSRLLLLMLLLSTSCWASQSEAFVFV